MTVIGPFENIPDNWDAVRRIRRMICIRRAIMNLLAAEIRNARTKRPWPTDADIIALAKSCGEEALYAYCKKHKALIDKDFQRLMQENWP